MVTVSVGLSNRRIQRQVGGLSAFSDRSADSVDSVAGRRSPWFQPMMRGIVSDSAAGQPDTWSIRGWWWQIIVQLARLLASFKLHTEKTGKRNSF